MKHRDAVLKKGGLRVLRKSSEVLLLCLLLSSCSLFAPVKSEPPTTYLINAAPYPATAKTHTKVSLLVNTPDGNPIYNSTAIAYTTHPYQIGYFVKSAWAEAPTQMLQPLIIQALQRTHYFQRVGSATSVGQYSYILNTHLVELEQDFSCTPPRLRLVLRAEIIQASSNQVLSAQEFRVNERIVRNDTYTGVIATNRATVQILNQLAAFSVRTLKDAG